MRRIQTTLTATLATSILTACGGGGGGGDSTQQSGPLDKYVRSYTYCERHEKAQLTIAAVNSNTVSVSQRSDYYQETNCAGAVVGTETNSQSLLATYVSTETATVTGWPAVASSARYSVDRVTINLPAYTVSLTGSGVSIIGGQPCVSYTGGRVCLNQTSIPAQTFPAGFVLTDTALLMVEPTSTGYERVDAYPR